jgi:predicted RNA-binding protein with PUA-like domain
MHYWLMKSEPTSFSIEDLAKSPQQKEPWDGVRNYQARNFLQAMRLDDLAFFYHSNCPNPGIVGIVQIIKSAYPDKSAFDPSDHHYDPKSTIDKPRWFCVDVKFVNKCKHVALATLKNQANLSSMRLLQRGNRLSVMPITSEEWAAIMKFL